MGFALSGGEPSDDFYREKVEAPFQADPFQAFWTFSNFHHKIEDDYGNIIASVKQEIGEVEKRALAMQKPLEEAALQLYPVDKTIALEILANYSGGLY